MGCGASSSASQPPAQKSDMQSKDSKQESVNTTAPTSNNTTAAPPPPADNKSERKSTSPAAATTAGGGDKGAGPEKKSGDEKKKDADDDDDSRDHLAGKIIKGAAAAIDAGSNAQQSASDALAKSQYIALQHNLPSGASPLTTAQEVLDNVSLLAGHGDVKKVLSAGWVIVSESAKFFTIGKIAVAIIEQIYNMWNSWGAKVRWVGEFIVFLKLVEIDLVNGMKTFEHVANLKILEIQLKESKELIQKITSRSKAASFIFAMYDEQQLSEQKIKIEQKKAACLFGHTTDIKSATKTNLALMRQIESLIQERQNRIESYKVFPGGPEVRARKMENLKKEFVLMDMRDEIEKIQNKWIIYRRRKKIKTWIAAAEQQQQQQQSISADSAASADSLSKIKEERTNYISTHLKQFLVEDWSNDAAVPKQPRLTKEEIEAEKCAAMEIQDATAGSAGDESTIKLRAATEEERGKLIATRKERLQSELSSYHSEILSLVQAGTAADLETAMQQVLQALVNIEILRVWLPDTDEGKETDVITQYIKQFNDDYKLVRTAQYEKHLILKFERSTAADSSPSSSSTSPAASDSSASKLDSATLSAASTSISDADVLSLVSISPSERVLYTAEFRTEFSLELLQFEWALQMNKNGAKQVLPGWPAGKSPPTTKQIMAIRAPPPRQHNDVAASQSANSPSPVAGADAAVAPLSPSSPAASPTGAGASGAAVTPCLTKDYTCSLFLSYAAEFYPDSLRALHFVPDAAEYLADDALLPQRKAARQQVRRAQLIAERNAAMERQKADPDPFYSEPAPIPDELPPESREETRIAEEEIRGILNPRYRADLSNIFPSLALQLSQSLPIYQKNLLFHEIQLKRKKFLTYNPLDFLMEFFISKFTAKDSVQVNPNSIGNNNSNSSNSGADKSAEIVSPTNATSAAPSSPSSPTPAAGALTPTSPSAAAAADNNTAPPSLVIRRVCVAIDGAAFTQTPPPLKHEDDPPSSRSIIAYAESIAKHTPPPASLYNFEDTFLTMCAKSTLPDWCCFLLTLPYDTTRFDRKVQVHSQVVQPIQITKRAIEEEEEEKFIAAMHFGN